MRAHLHVFALWKMVSSVGLWFQNWNAKDSEVGIYSDHPLLVMRRVVTPNLFSGEHGKEPGKLAMGGLYFVPAGGFEVMN